MSNLLETKGKNVDQRITSCMPFPIQFHPILRFLHLIIPFFFFLCIWYSVSIREIANLLLKETDKILMNRSRRTVHLHTIKIYTIFIVLQRVSSLFVPCTRVISWKDDGVWTQKNGVWNLIPKCSEICFYRAKLVKDSHPFQGSDVTQTSNGILF